MAEEYGYGLKIPKERIAVLIGTDGETKKQIEESTKTKSPTCFSCWFGSSWTESS